MVIMASSHILCGCKTKNGDNTGGVIKPGNLPHNGLISICSIAYSLNNSRPF